MLNYETKGEEKSPEWLREYPVTLTQFIVYLYHNAGDFMPVFMTEDVLTALVGTLFPSVVLSSKSSPVDSNPPTPIKQKGIYLSTCNLPNPPMVNFASFSRFYDRFKVGGKEERGGGERRPEQPPSEEKHSQLYACHDCGLLVPCTEPKVSSGHRPALECPSGKYDSRSTMQVFIQLH